MDHSVQGLPGASASNTDQKELQGKLKQVKAVK